MGRFILHMLVASILAPAMGGAAYSFFTCDWHNSMFLSRLLGSIVGGFALLVFVWFWTVPFGILTFCICWGLHEANVKHRILWAIGGAAVGWLFGLFMGTWAGVSISVFEWSGTVIGTAAGMMLREIWFKEWETDIADYNECDAPRLEKQGDLTTPNHTGMN
jgi:hypothetical protein